MNKIFLSLIIILSAITFSNGQKIKIIKELGGHQYYLEDANLGLNDLKYLMSTNPEAMVYINKSKTGNGFVSALGFIGGFMIGYPIGSVIGGSDPNWTLAYIGLGVIAVAIPISIGVDKNSKKAVDIYNASLEDHSLKMERPNFNLNVNGNAIGLVMNF